MSSIASIASIDLVGVAHAYTDSVPLFADVRMRLASGWTGVVGPNGAGKTTLLRILAGELEPDAGSVKRHPPGLTARLCAQRVEHLDAASAALATSPARAAQRLRGRLRLDPGALDRWDALSPGERKRWQLAAALAEEPHVLLLDEPTNHLDADARELLLGALPAHRGIGLLVSHDRDLLQGLTTSTIRFHQGSVSLHRGAYEEARAAWEAAERGSRDALAKLAGERRRLERRLFERRGRRAQAESRMRTSRRMKGRGDSDARDRYKKKRRRSADVSLGREIGVVRGRLERVERRLGHFRFEKELGRSLFVDWEAAPVPHLLVLDAPVLRAGERELLRDVRVEVRRESRIRLAGPNGSGKTTLLRELVASARIPPGRLLHLPQELSERDGRVLLDEARALAPDARGRVLHIVAALGVDPDALLASELPSPGEARKLALAGGLARRVFALVLDEPTNHLDLPSIERVEQALAAYPGALVVATHDDAFARRLATTRWELRDGRVRVGAETGADGLRSPS